MILNLRLTSVLLIPLSNCYFLLDLICALGEHDKWKNSFSFLNSWRCTTLISRQIQLTTGKVQFKTNIIVSIRKVIIYTFILSIIQAKANIYGFKNSLYELLLLDFAYPPAAVTQCIVTSSVFFSL